jgi:adenosyl cobinamide kinase/adenosyl cobinamide phosphate guanylyltransferase
MILIIGGAYQGKLQYVTENYAVDSRQVCNCDVTYPIVPDKKVLYHYEKLVLRLLENDIDPVNYTKEKLADFADKIIICDDISCGVVPVEPLMRKWREAVGRCMALLSKKSDRVIRVFCGIGTVLS